MSSNPMTIADVYPDWMFNLEVLQAVKEKVLTGRPCVYVMHTDISAGSDQSYTLTADENELWFFDGIQHGSIVLPDQFTIALSIEAQDIIESQILRECLLGLTLKTSYPFTGSVKVDVTNNDAINQHTYEAVIYYRKFSKSTIDKALDLFGMDDRY